MSNVLRLDKTWFNPLYFHVRHYLRESQVRHILNYGSSSAGKSYSDQQALVVDGHVNNYSSLLFRKEQSNIKDTIKNDVDQIVQKLRLFNIYEKMDFEFRNKVNGEVIRFRGLDKDSKIKGLKGFKKLYFDELDQFTFQDWREANRRLRGEEGQQIIASWNPVNENHWIKKQVIDTKEWIDLPKVVDMGELTEFTRLHEDSFVKRSKDGRTILIKTTFKDNKWVVGGNVNGVNYGYVDQQALAEFEEMRQVFPDEYRVYGKGEWGITKNDNPWLTQYNPRVHKSLDGYDYFRHEPIWVGFDFNYNPTSCTVTQFVDGWGAVTLREFQCVGGTKALCQYLETTDLMDTEKSMWIITGDHSGMSKSSVAGSVNDYQIIKEHFNLNDFQFVNVETVNRSHEYSRKLCNYFLWAIPFVIDESCEVLSTEMQIAEPDGSGRLKKNRDDYQMDILDSWRYTIDAKFPEGIPAIRQFAERCKMDFKI